MSIKRSKIYALLLALSMLPGAAEIVENAVHIAIEGHLAHAAPDGDRHEPNGPEHGCTPILHLCGCHANLAFIDAQSPPPTSLRASRFDGAPVPAEEPPAIWPAIERPPRA